MTKIRCHAHAVIANGQVFRDAILTIDAEAPSSCPLITPFSTETEATTSFNGIILLAPEGYTLPAGYHDSINPDTFPAIVRQLAAEVPHTSGRNFTVIRLPF